MRKLRIAFLFCILILTGIFSTSAQTVNASLVTGADAKDDKGQPIENKAMRDSARFRYLIDFDKSGDIVAGINR